MGKAPEGYIEVGERIARFYEKFPDGSLRAWHRPYLETVGERVFVVYAAAAYRTPDDDKPGIGYAWEPVPGPTSFTKDSELMNAETSAWGRAIAALGFETREHVASANEVRARTGDDGKLSDAQRKKIYGLIRDLEKLSQHPWPPHADWKAAMDARCHELFNHGISALTKSEASTVIDQMTEHIKKVMEDPPHVESEFKSPLVPEEEEVPF